MASHLRPIRWTISLQRARLLRNRQQVVVPVTQVTNMAATPPRENRPRRVTVTLMKKFNVKNLNESLNQKPWIYISMMNYQCSAQEQRVYPSDQYKDRQEHRLP